MLNYKYLSDIGEKDYKRIKDKFTIAMNDISFLKESREQCLVNFISLK